MDHVLEIVINAEMVLMSKESEDVSQDLEKNCRDPDFRLYLLVIDVTELISTFEMILIKNAHCTY